MATEAASVGDIIATARDDSIIINNDIGYFGWSRNHGADNGCHAARDAVVPAMGEKVRGIDEGA